VVLAMINVVGGYLVTDRMLGMFKKQGRRDEGVMIDRPTAINSATSPPRSCSSSA
jgi:NAD/NADP transhydrogenase alpha subunit